MKNTIAALSFVLLCTSASADCLSTIEDTFTHYMVSAGRGEPVIAAINVIQEDEVYQILYTPGDSRFDILNTINAYVSVSDKVCEVVEFSNEDRE